VAGLGRIGDDPGTVRHSFWAAAICLPIFLALRLLAWRLEGAPAAGPVAGLLAEGLGFVIAWAGFALLSHRLAEVFGRQAEWPGFLAAWNWTNVVQYGALLAVSAPAAFGLRGPLFGGLSLAVLGYALWLEWFVARGALRLAPGQAAMLVGFDLLLSLFVNGLVGVLLE
jgi:hypothetical protein